MSSTRRKRTPEERKATAGAGRADNQWAALQEQRLPGRSASPRGPVKWPAENSLEEVEYLSPGPKGEAKRLRLEGRALRKDKRTNWTEWYEYGGKQYMCNALLGTCVALGGAALAYYGLRGGGTRRKRRRRNT